MASILVIDDNETVRQTIDNVLNAAGHAVTCAHDGAAGLEFLTNNNYDLIITDILMPNIEGIELIRSVRKNGVACPIIAISGGTKKMGQDFLKMSESLGATATLPKPFSAQELLDVVSEALA